MNKFFEGLSNDDMHNIKKIADRYVAQREFFVDPLAVISDITIYHQNFHKLALFELANAPRDNTIKVVVAGLRHHIRNHPVG